MDPDRDGPILPSDPPCPLRPPRPPRSGRQVLFYDPDGPIGGTFTCTVCLAQGWQPDLLQHAADCPYRSSVTEAAR
jgi:hypothetical protein